MSIDDIIKSHKEKHLTKEQFFKLFDKRLIEYQKAIIGNKGHYGLTFGMKTGAIRITQEFRGQIEQHDVFGDGFWGYGINTVSDGIENQSHLDVEEIKKEFNLNKHAESYRVLLLLIFKVEGEKFFTSLFAIDTVQGSINSRINTAYKLSSLENVRFVTLNDQLQVEIFFESAKMPVKFRIDRNGYGNKLMYKELAKFYLDSVNVFAKTYAIIPENNNSNLEARIDKLEIEIRGTVFSHIVTSSGINEWQNILTGKIKNQVSSRINEHLELHPNQSAADYALFESVLEFLDIDHLKKLVLHEKWWTVFSNVFKDRSKVEKYFDQLNNARKTFKHHREPSRLIMNEGEASVEWFRMVLDTKQG